LQSLNKIEQFATPVLMHLPPFASHLVGVLMHLPNS
jgi:hypothetical protein